MTKEEIQKMTWKELMAQIRTYQNCCLDCEHFVILNLTTFLNLQREFMDSLQLRGLMDSTGRWTKSATPYDKQQAIFRKSKLVDVLNALQDPKRIHPVDIMIQPRFASIYPMPERYPNQDWKSENPLYTEKKSKKK